MSQETFTTFFYQSSYSINNSIHTKHDPWRSILKFLRFRTTASHYKLGSITSRYSTSDFCGTLSMETYSSFICDYNCFNI